MERRPTLPVTEILAAEQQERSWESGAPVPGRWGHPSVADRGRGIGDLGMAGLNIGAPARLQRGGRTLMPAGASTPLGGGSGENRASPPVQQLDVSEYVTASEAGVGTEGTRRIGPVSAVRMLAKASIRRIGNCRVQG